MEDVKPSDLDDLKKRLEGFSAADFLSFNSRVQKKIKSDAPGPWKKMNTICGEFLRAQRKSIDEMRRNNSEQFTRLQERLITMYEESGEDVFKKISPAEGIEVMDLFPAENQHVIIERFLQTLKPEDFITEASPSHVTQPITAPVSSVKKRGFFTSLFTSQREKEMELISAAKTGTREEVQACIDDKVSVNATDSQGWTALHWAVHYNRLAVVEVLLKNSADIHANANGLTPMSLAQQKPEMRALITAKMKGPGE